MRLLFKNSLRLFLVMSLLIAVFDIAVSCLYKGFLPPFRTLWQFYSVVVVGNVYLEASYSSS